MASVSLHSLSKNFGAVQAVRGVSLEIEDGEFVVFVGPSGCGKSTLLRMIAGLEDISSGKLRIGGKPMNDVPAADRGIAMVFQSYALYPHMNVRENIGFGLKMAGMAAKDVAAKVDEAARMLQIGDLLDRKPRELSGGQRQRVAIGRAIVKQPGAFLFDEPLSNLDADLRAQMRMEIAKLHKSFASTIVYVTHDQVEAMTLADRIVVLRDGQIEQIGTPTDLFERPANIFVARFLGTPKMNLIAAVPASIDGRPAARLTPDCSVPLPEGVTLDGAGKAWVGVRPGDFTVSSEPASGTQLAGQVELVEHLGDEALAYVGVPGIAEPLVAKLPKATTLTSGDGISLGFAPSSMHLFGAGGVRLAGMD